MRAALIALFLAFVTTTASAKVQVEEVERGGVPIMHQRASSVIIYDLSPRWGHRSWNHQPHFLPHHWHAPPHRFGFGFGFGFNDFGFGFHDFPQHHHRFHRHHRHHHRFPHHHHRFHHHRFSR